MSDGTVNSSGDGKLWFGHPPQLARLFTTEMWERFGFYGMRVILTLYLSKHFLFGDHTTGGLYGAYTSLVYLTPLIGGLLADRYLGSKRSVKFGAILMAIGYFGLCFGGEKAKPKLIIYKTPPATKGEAPTNGTTYDVQIIKNEDKTTRQVNIDGSDLVISANEEGALKLSPVDGATGQEQLIENGMYQFNGERDPFWVNLLFIFLSFVIVGNGFFKPNISTIVGSLYAKDDPRRDGGFTIFYMGINIGSMLSQALCPWVAENVGWWAGFLLAALGMLLSWSLFQFDGNRLKGYGDRPAGASTRYDIPIYIGAVLAIPVMYALLYNTMLSAEAAAMAAKDGTGFLGYLAGLPLLGKVLFFVFTISTIGIPIWAAYAGTREECEKMIVAIVLIVFSVVFWMLFEQAGTSLTLFADRNTQLDVNLVVTEYKMPAGQTQIFNPLFIVLFAPVFSWLWTWLGKRNLEPSVPVKFALALLLAGLGFLVLVLGAKYADSGFKVGLIWLVVAYLIHSVGELCLSPVGLSMITKLSITRVVGLMMGVWFMSSSVAQYVAGIVAQFASVETVGGEVTNPKEALETYVTVFQTIGLWGVGFGIALLAVSPILKRMMHGVN